MIPKQEIDYIFDLSDDDLAAMHVFAKSVARAIEKAVPCKRVGVADYGNGSSSCSSFTLFLINKGVQDMINF